jgi:hypothetical protein
MDTVLKKQTASIFRATPEDAPSSLLSNNATQITCYPILHHIVYSPLRNTEAKNTVDGSCREN